MNPDQPRPEYLNDPIVGKYAHQLFHLIDELFEAIHDVDIDSPAGQLFTILRVVHNRTVVKGELDELHTILQVHFPIEYAPADSDSVPSLIEYPLSTSN